ncbi:MAG: DUF5106 domain-containing protein [Rikenellaceae bacterium]
MKALRYLLWAFLCFLALSCVEGKRGSGSTTASESTVQVDKATTAERGFSMPKVPSHILPEERMSYLAEHFWDSYNLSDSLLLANRDVTDGAFASYLWVLQQLQGDSVAVAKSVDRLLSRSVVVESTAFERFTALFEDYLYNANSPFLNEELYIPVLRFIVGCDELDEIYKFRPQRQLTMALKNRMGAEALDFSYTLADGRSARMHSLRSPYTILFFNNPDCADCARVKEYFQASALFRELWQRGELKVLSVYPDPDLELWKQSSYPEILINSYDAKQAISEGQLYDLKAIPTLYLLDEDKRVLLKDAPVEGVEAYLKDMLK